VPDRRFSGKTVRNEVLVGVLGCAAGNEQTEAVAGATHAEALAQLVDIKINDRRGEKRQLLADGKAAHDSRCPGACDASAGADRREDCEQNIAMKKRLQRKGEDGAAQF
jgi:hypothetical protein